MENTFQLLQLLGNKKYKAHWDQPTVKLTDPYGVTMHKTEFNAIVKNYHRSGSWWININILGGEETSDLITSSVS